MSPTDKDDQVDRLIDERVRQIIGRAKAQRAVTGQTNNPSRKKRLARARVLEELPLLTARLTRCVSDLNDCLGDEGVWMIVGVGDRTPTTEAVFTVAVEDGEDGPDLIFNVDYAGHLTGMLTRGDRRSLIHASTVFDADTGFLLNCLLELLEAKYPVIEGA